jgi:hypothetical protein
VVPVPVVPVEPVPQLARRQTPTPIPPLVLAWVAVLAVDPQSEDRAQTPTPMPPEPVVLAPVPVVLPVPDEPVPVPPLPVACVVPVVPAVDVVGAAARLTVEVTGAVARLTDEVTGAAALATVELACDTVADAWLTVEAAAELPAEPAVELAGAVALETRTLTALVKPVTVPVTVLVTAPRRPPPEPDAGGAGADDAGVAASAWLVVAAWALEPDRSQQMAIRPRQQLASIRTRRAIRPPRLWPADTHASGTAYSTPPATPMIAATATSTSHRMQAY